MGTTFCCHKSFPIERKRSRKTSYFIKKLSKKGDSLHGIDYSSESLNDFYLVSFLEKPRVYYNLEDNRYVKYHLSCVMKFFLSANFK